MEPTATESSIKHHELPLPPAEKTALDRSEAAQASSVQSAASAQNMVELANRAATVAVDVIDEVSSPSLEPAPSQPLTRGVSFPEYGRDYRCIDDLFSEETGQYIEEFFSSPEADALPGIVREHRKIYYTAREIPLYFSAGHELENPESVCPKNAGLALALEEITLLALSRFAQELKLQGRHLITCQMVSYTPPSDLTLGQGWHFDLGAKETMVAVLQNDFSTIVPNAGLDLSVNTVESVFNPFELSKDADAVPEPEYLVVPYPRYGALFVHGRQGKIIHKMSSLAARTFPKERPLKRTIIQIFRRDEEWCANWQRTHGVRV